MKVADEVWEARPRGLLRGVDADEPDVVIC